MVERIQDLNLPNAIIAKIIKDALPPDVNIDKEGRVAIARATSVFIMYLSSNAAAIAHKQNHKTFTANDVFTSIEEMEFKNFLPPMQNVLTTFRQSLKDKKDKKQNDEKGKELPTSAGIGKMDVSKNLSNTGATTTTKSTPKVMNIDEVITIDDDSD